MLYAVIMRFDSLREISTSMLSSGVPSDIKFTSAATNDSFMLQSSRLSKEDIVVIGRIYIDYEKFEELTIRIATMVRICLMYYVNFYSLFNSPEKDWEMVCKSVTQEPPNPSLFD